MGHVWLPSCQEVFEGLCLNPRSMLCFSKLNISKRMRWNDFCLQLRIMTKLESFKKRKKVTNIPRVYRPLFGLMFHSLSLKASNIFQQKMGYKGGPRALVAGRGRSPFRRPKNSKNRVFFNPCITGRGPSYIGCIGCIAICFLPNFMEMFFQSSLLRCFWFFSLDQRDPR